MIGELIKKYKWYLIGIIAIYAVISLWLFFLTESPQTVPFEYDSSSPSLRRPSPSNTRSTEEEGAAHLPSRSWTPPHHFSTLRRGSGANPRR